METGNEFFTLFDFLFYELKSVVILKNASLNILGTRTAFRTAVFGINKNDLC
jgi:hypothetical protein